MRIMTVIGARPQFIKAGVVSRAIARTEGLDEVIVHTGQHFDANMSQVFFDQLGLPKPDHLFDINGGSHGEMTGRMLTQIEAVIGSDKPDVMMVYGDTNSTLAGALAAAKLHVPVAHVEAGLRSFNMKMPEEINRILTDNISDILFCPTQVAVDQLSREGFDQKPAKVEWVGDVMQDSALTFADMAQMPSEVAGQTRFVLATVHRAENTDVPERLAAIVHALNTVHRDVAPVILPLHPRTKKMIAQAGLSLEVRTIDPVGYLEFLALLKDCALVATDSGGVQKEAFFFTKPGVVMRDQTEWTELVENGANVLVGADAEQIVAETRAALNKTIMDDGSLYGGGTASNRIANSLKATFF
ncbi:non-hydrolyzing UDP-N-acetylglucosamine 2-epimerase [Cognatishimia sp. MH4019]|uniref:non-hydrolyzing UDP-N-acetylglucosamine 2-epimerase n=1 Tax=Cognatishimia sp. MH4019 TaxID=2854030 RepID=UPI001CD7FFA7|nr:UDP-N-acetylglucosamine 2-epimerase (non-hydrolyzing) [Cognatishimia sp. MH4019]